MKASIIIPAYNAEKTIAKCLDSMASQSFNDFEVIVVDDGSNDRTAAVVKAFPNVRLVRQKNSGPAVARNLGAGKAKGEILVFTDSDCVADRNWLQGMLKPFGKSEVAGVQGKYKSRQKELIARLIQLEIEARHEKMQKREFIDFIGTYSAAYKKKLFEKMNGFDTSFPIASGEDTDLSFRMNKAGHKMVFNQEAFVFHSHPTSLWKYLKIKFFRAFWRTKVYKSHREKMVKDSYTSQTVKLQALLFFLLFPAAAAALLLPALSFLLVANAVALLLTTIPFTVWVIQKDKAVGVVSPAVIMLRTGAFGLGLAAGTIRELKGK